MDPFMAGTYHGDIALFMSVTRMAPHLVPVSLVGYHLIVLSQDLLFSSHVMFLQAPLSFS